MKWVCSNLRFHAFNFASQVYLELGQSERGKCKQISEYSLFLTDCELV